MSREVKGCIDKIRYQNGDFVVAAFKVEDGTKIVIKGDIPGVTVGLAYVIEVEEYQDERFGLTYKVVAAFPDLPTSEDAIERYLVDLPGVGQVMAEKLIRSEGKECIDHLIEEPEAVAKRIKGLSATKAKAISQHLSERRQDAENIITLRTLLRVAPPHVIKKAVKKWGANARVVVEENPYDLIKLPGVGFKIADSVALSIGVEKDDDVRLVEALLHVVRERRNSGHTSHPLRSVCLVAMNLAGAGDREDIARLAEEDDRIVTWPGADVLQLRSDHQDESAICEFAIERSEVDAAEITLDIPEGLAVDQAEAFMLIHQHPKLFLLTGAPGTGKTHLMRAVVEKHGGALLMAPTGKAAKRLSEATGIEAMTIHRALGVQFEGKDKDWSFKHNADNPLSAAMVVVDEASMVDTRLFRQLIDAIAPSTNVLIVGDDNQLPSVGPGAVLRDLIRSGVPQYELTEIKRQDPGAIVQTCHLLKDGLPPRADLFNISDLLLKQVQGDQSVLRDATLHAYFVGIPNMIKNQYPSRFEGLSDAESARLFCENIQILSPFRKNGQVATDNLNKLIREELFDLGVIERIGKYRFAKGDRIIQMSNDYDIGVFNGDTGTVKRAVKDPKRLGESDWYYEIEWDSNEDAERWVPCGKNNMDWSYAVTVHKSQGSEWPIVLIPLASGAFFGRQLFYTAISRAKNLCAIVGHFGNMQVIAANTSSAQRETGIQQKIAGWATAIEE